MRKIAVITGGSRGLGKDMAIRLAEQGKDVVITYQTQQQKAEEVVSELEKLGAKAACLQLHVENHSNFSAFVEQLKSLLATKFGCSSFDFLVNNAGVGLHSMITETKEEEFDLLNNIHFKGVYFLTQALLPIMNDGGAIVNISSGLARFSLPGYAAYGAMKAAIEAYSRYAAKELGSRKIRVNVVAPGAIETDFNAERFQQMPQVKEFIASQTALGRVGQAEDIGGIVAFLCSEAGYWINGQRIEASGGMYL